jgi:hypothetical protein
MFTKINLEDRTGGTEMRALRILVASFAMVTASFLAGFVYGSEFPPIAKVRNLARQPVERILAGTPVEFVSSERYPRVLADTRSPLIAFFYGNLDSESQRVATLIRYLAPEYRGRIRFCAVRTASRGKPSSQEAQYISRSYGVRSVPGVLFYDNPGQRLVLEQQEYIAADFKEFRTPRMFMWRTYYQVVKSELDKLLAD